MLYPMLEIVFRHRWRYLTLLVVLPLIGALVCIPLYPKSTASELIWVQNQNLLQTGQPAYKAYLTPAQVAQGDFEQYIQTHAFAVGVYKKLSQRGVDDSQAVSIANGIHLGLLATTKGNNVLLLGYTCTQPVSLCPVILSTSWDVYESYSAASVNNQLKVVEQAYQQQVQQAQQQLNSANAAVNSYLAQHPAETQAQQATDPTLSSLIQNGKSAEQALATAQAKLSNAQAQANTNQISVSSLYTVVGASHTNSGRLSRLPTKQMLLVAAVFWALAAISLIVTSRVQRVVRHPNQLATALGIEVAAVMHPIPAPRSRRAGPSKSREATA